MLGLSDKICKLPRGWKRVAAANMRAIAPLLRRIRKQKNS